MNTKETLKTCLDLIEISQTAYLTVIEENGYPTTRAMLNLRNKKQYPSLVHVFEKQNDDLLVYFTTNTSSSKIKSIMSNSKASVYYCKPEEWRGVMLNGNIELVSNIDIKKSLWQKEWEMYYTKGVKDPDYAILCFKTVFIKGYHQFNQYKIGVPTLINIEPQLLVT